MHHAGEGNFEEAFTGLTSLRWMDWGKPVAHGVGEFQGNMEFRARARVSLSDLRSCHGAMVYSRFTIKIHGDDEYTMPINGC